MRGQHPARRAHAVGDSAHGAAGLGDPRAERDRHGDGAGPGRAEPQRSDLAETGSSSATPVIGGAAVAVLLAGGGILWSVRKRRTAQH